MSIVVEKGTIQLTVFFEEPFWVGVFERTQEGRLSAARVTFGGEPRDYEVYDFLQKRYFELPFSPAVTAQRREGRKNPKRRQREVKKQLEAQGIGTKSWQALKLQQEQMKTEKRADRRIRKEEQKQHQFDLKQQKKRKNTGENRVLETLKGDRNETDRVDKNSCVLHGKAGSI